jgi:hypothetical protein
VNTGAGIPVKGKLLYNYFCNLVNQVYKILPMREQKSETLDKYIWRLHAEFLGFAGTFPDLQEDAYFASLLSILQYLRGHCMKDSVGQTKHLVFECISLCEKLSLRYADGPAETKKAGD